MFAISALLLIGCADLHGAGLSPALPPVTVVARPSPRPVVSSPRRAPVAASAVIPPFDWAHAVCPRPAKETAAVFLPRAVTKGPASQTLIVALKSDDSTHVEARFTFEDGSEELTHTDRVYVRDADTNGYIVHAAGTARAVAVMIRAGQRVAACRKLGTRAAPASRSWDAKAEALYALWVARLFSFPMDDAFGSLEPILRSPERNILHNVLGLAEDGPKSKLNLSPDCADFPLTLRAYFAWKLGLSFGMARAPRERWGTGRRQRNERGETGPKRNSVRGALPRGKNP